MPELMLSRPVARLLPALLAGLLSLAFAPVALAHSNEVSADPPAESVLDQAPDRVTLTFDEPLLDAGAALVVSAGDGTVVSVDPPLIDGKSISTALAAGVPGTYQVSYRVVSGDGHPVTGEYSFTVVGQVASPAQGSVSPEPTLVTQEAESGTPDTGSPNTGSPNTGSPNTGSPNTGSPNTVLLGLGLVALVAIACVIVLVARRRST